MTVKLTDRFLASRKAPALGRTIYTDSTVPGLTFRVSAPTELTLRAAGTGCWLPTPQTSTEGSCARRLSRHIALIGSTEGRGHCGGREAGHRSDRN